jgi:hypothetical protein
VTPQHHCPPAAPPSRWRTPPPWPAPNAQPSPLPPPLARTLWQAARVAYGTVLAALAPPRLEERSSAGMIRKIADRINVQRGTRSYKSAWYNGRFTRDNEPRPFDQVRLLTISCSPAATLCLNAMLSAQAIDRRRDLDQAVSATGKLVAGASAIASSSRLPCTVVEIDYELDTCMLEFESQGVKRVQSFTSIGAKPGGARLHRVIPTLQPGPRRKRGDEKADKARSKVEELFKTEGATSPSMRDQVRAALLWPCASSLRANPTAVNRVAAANPAIFTRTVTRNGAVTSAAAIFPAPLSCNGAVTSAAAILPAPLSCNGAVTSAAAIFPRAVIL